MERGKSRDWIQDISSLLNTLVFQGDAIYNRSYIQQDNCHLLNATIIWIFYFLIFLVYQYQETESEWRKEIYTVPSLYIIFMHQVFKWISEF